MSKRGREWVDFSTAVHYHVESYTVKQYGDKGKDLATDYTPEQCLAQIKKYVARHGKQGREGQDQLDLMKIAHYAQMAWSMGNDTGGS